MIAGLIEINAQLVQLHHDYSTGGDGAHLVQGSVSNGTTCPTNPVQIDAQGFPNHIPCPCENEHIGNLTGTPGPTLIACPPALISNMRDELKKFSNLDVRVIYEKEPAPDWRHYAPASQETLLALSRTVIIISTFQIRNVIISQALSNMVIFDSNNEVHKATRNNLDLMVKREFSVARENADTMLAVWKISPHARRKTLLKIRVLHVPFARVFIDEGHNVRKANTETLGWLKYIRSPVWIVSGTSGWMPPHRWSGWVKIWEQPMWASHPDMRRYTSVGFSRIQKAFKRAAKDFDPAAGVPSPVCEIGSDGYDTGPTAARNKQQALGEGLRTWSDFLQQVMIRRTHRDRIWGEPLLDLPEGEMQGICVRFCDTEREVQGKYQEAVRAAICDAYRGSQVQVPGNSHNHQELMINMYRRCRIASSIPALCCIPSFKDGKWRKQDVKGYRTRETRDSSPYKSHIKDIIRLSPKLLWLRDFITDHHRPGSENSNEKLLIFSFSPTVLHCVDLV